MRMTMHLLCRQNSLLLEPLLRRKSLAQHSLRLWLGLITATMTTTTMSDRDHCPQAM